MMKRREFIISNSSRRGLAHLMVDIISTNAVGTTIIVEAAGKSRAMENRYHPMIRDIAQQCEFNGRKYNEQSWKRLLVEAFVNVMQMDAEGSGRPDPFPDQVELVEGLDNEIVALGAQTRRFSRDQANNFIEYLFAYGAENGVIWKEPAQRVIREMLDRKNEGAAD
jgi:hypothetical protein